MINLFTSYFILKDAQRQQEVDRCLWMNIANPKINKIYLFLDDELEIEKVINKFGHTKLNLISLGRRPTYKDWIIWSESLSESQISIFANSDIYFDQTIEKFEHVKENSLICLSRYNFRNNNWFLQEQPEWSQDVWAIKSNQIISFKDQLNIEIGRPSCDNKMACVFAINGWDLFNPYREIKCFHFHRSIHRDYKKHSANYAGFFALVPESNFNNPSEITIVASPIKGENIKDIQISNFLEKGLSNET
jgi:hypothetical protein